MPDEKEDKKAPKDKAADKATAQTVEPGEATSEQLANRRTELVKAIREGVDAAKKAAEEGNPDPTKLDELVTMRTELDAVDAELTTRAAAAEEYIGKLAALGTDLEPAQTDETGTDENKESEKAPEAPAAPTAPAAPAAEAPAALAAGGNKIKQPSVRIQVPAAIDLNVPDGSDNVTEARPALAIVAAAEVDGVSAGTQFRDAGHLGKAFVDKARALTRGRGRSSAKLAAITAAGPGGWSDDRLLTGDPEANGRKIAAVLDQWRAAPVEAFASAEALVAAGCAPAMPSYRMVTLGERGTPVIDGLPQFGVSGARGRVAYEQPPSIGDVTGAVGYWTTEDEGDDEAEKAILFVDCGTAIERELEAVYVRLEARNFDRLAYPEKFQAYFDLAMVYFDRRREMKALRQIYDGTTIKAVEVATYLSSYRDTVNGIAQLQSNLRSYYRVPPDFRFDWIAPFWLRDAMVEDLRNQMPGDQTLSGARAIIDAAFREENINPIWHRDEVLGTGLAANLVVPQIANLQDANAPVREFRATAQTFLFPAGTYFYVGGETLNFGTEIRDSALNARNRVQSFFEMSELVVMNGTVSAEVLIDVCTRGAAASLEDVNCVAGS